MVFFDFLLSVFSFYGVMAMVLWNRRLFLREDTTWALHGTCC